MSEEEMQQKMEFIINQQAQFAADIQKLQESHGKLADAMIGVVGMIGSLAQAQERMAQHLIELAEAQKHTDEKINELTTAQAETDERLNVFINVVERYISERRNGRNGQSPAGGKDESAPSS